MKNITSRKVMAAARAYLRATKMNVDDVARVSGLSKRTLERAIRLLKSGKRKLIKRVDNGELSVSRAAELLSKKNSKDSTLIEKTQLGKRQINKLSRILDTIGISFDELIKTVEELYSIK